MTTPYRENEEIAAEIPSPRWRPPAWVAPFAVLHACCLTIGEIVDLAIGGHLGLIWASGVCVGMIGFAALVLTISVIEEGAG